MTKKFKILLFSFISIAALTSIITPTSIFLLNQNKVKSNNENVANILINNIKENESTNKNIKVKNNTISIFEINENNFKIFLDNLPIVSNILATSNIENIPDNIEIDYNNFIKSDDLLKNPFFNIDVKISVGEKSNKIERKTNLKINGEFLSNLNYLKKIILNYNKANLENRILPKDNFTNIKVEDLNSDNLLENIIGLEIFPNVIITVPNVLINKLENSVNFKINVKLENTDSSLLTDEIRVSF